jgi:hypothetical protein
MNYSSGDGEKMPEQKATVVRVDTAGASTRGVAIQLS